jgi:E3 ubiquitin-protein ligase BRE1
MAGQERILVLVSEITRLKAQLAAQAGEEDLMNFILGEQTEGASYVKDLQTKLQ